MTGLISTRAARRRGVVFTILVGVSALLMLFSSSPFVLEVQKGIGFALAPFQNGLTGVAREASSLVQTVSEIDRLRNENEQLRRDNDRLAAENQRLRPIATENEQLSAILGLKSSLTYKTVAAEVIGRETLETRRVVTIGRGADDGIKTGDVVIGEGGALAGRVAQVGPNFARVVLINDATSTVIGKVTSNDATGEVIGQLGGQLVMQNIDSTQRLQIGDQVRTAGIELTGGIRSPYPKDLVIGQITDVVRDPNAVVQTAYVEPLLDLDHLIYVLVVIDYEGGLPGADQIPTDQLNPDGTLPDTEQPYSSPAAP